MGCGVLIPAKLSHMAERASFKQTQPLPPHCAHRRAHTHINTQRWGAQAWLNSVKNKHAYTNTQTQTRTRAVCCTPWEAVDNTSESFTQPDNSTPSLDTKTQQDCC